MDNATKIKRTLLRGECVSPPHEIREQTKVRRAWLAEKLAEINQQPNREAKIVGLGSYQSISVYEVKSVAGRLRHRGICQFCGHSQVSDRKALVLHGYKRPGDGYVFGRCPGVGLPALNTDKTHTEKWLAEAIVAHETALEVEREAEITQDAAFKALYTEKVESREPDANKAAPDTLRSWLRPSESEKAAYRAARSLWANQYPLTAAHSDAKKAYERARQAVGIADSGVRHFQYLIDSKVYGTELTREVVA